MFVLKGSAMEKWLCWGSMGVAALLCLVFLLDLVAGFPFSSGTPAEGSSPFMLVDVFGLLASAILGYLGWNAFRDIR